MSQLTYFRKTYEHATRGLPSTISNTNMADVRSCEVEVTQAYDYFLFLFI